MYRTNNFQTNAKIGSKTYADFTYNPQYAADFSHKIQDVNLQQAIDRLIRENQDLSQKLNSEKQKNFDLLQVKRRMEEDVKRLEFEIQRIGTYQNLNSKQLQIKRNQTLIDNNKLKNQLDTYFQQNKTLRSEIRKWKTQCEKIVRQKEDLVNQNVLLLNQIANLKTKIAQSELKLQQYDQYIKNIIRSQGNGMNQVQKQGQFLYKNNRLEQLNSIRSQKQKSEFMNKNLPNVDSKQFLNSIVFNSPMNRNSSSHHHPTHIKSGGNQSTNPSQNKIPVYSPLHKDYAVKNGTQSVQQIYQEFYQENAQPSPRSFSNKRIQQNLQFLPGSPLNKQSLHSMNKFASPRNNIDWQKFNSPSVVSYGSRPSPMMGLNLNQNQSKNGKRVTQEQNSDRLCLQTYQKKQLKDEVSSLRNDLANDLLTKYYRTSIERAEKQKSNSLKIFINALQQKIDTLEQMVLNYLQARSMLAENCPTLRLKWQPNNPLNISQIEGETASQLMLKNSKKISDIYQSIKANGRKQKNVAGQYLALFRYLTLLNLQENQHENQIQPLLMDCIKHSALKQIHRIKAMQGGKACSDEE